MTSLKEGWLPVDFKAGDEIFLVLIFKEMEIDIIVVQMRKILTVLSMALLKS